MSASIADNSSVTLAVVAVLATCVGGLLWVIKFMFTKLLPVIEKGAKSNEVLVKATKQNTEQIKVADEYQRHRNGRDQEMHKELIKAIAEIPKQIVATGKISDASRKDTAKNTGDTAEAVKKVNKTLKDQT